MAFAKIKGPVKRNRGNISSSSVLYKLFVFINIHTWFKYNRIMHTWLKYNISTLKQKKVAKNFIKHCLKHINEKRT